eukprot:TRINITY_DN93933_c0_g1_i1.p1 TRINITY_DN93933_c0_g1~~TRINITY_DN93933_c0_g1_i1.p1  ORF type:complete len:342 (+),score=94.53 TRINITY_DN93933_c0_g1_i1:46-1026(+)
MASDGTPKKKRPMVPIFAPLPAASVAKVAKTTSADAAAPAAPAAPVAPAAPPADQKTSAPAAPKTSATSSPAPASQSAPTASAESSSKSPAAPTAPVASKAPQAPTLSSGEEERRRKAGVAAPSSGGGDVRASTPSAPAASSSTSERSDSTPSAKDSSSHEKSKNGANGGSNTSKKDSSSRQAAGPAIVYGFEEGNKLAETMGKAICLRLEPLKPELPEFEKVLGESKQSVTIGSNRGKVDVLVRDEAVSKRHVSLQLIGIKNDLALCVVDHSTNGSYLNGQRIPTKDKKFRIRNGDKLTVKSPSLDADFGWKVDFGNTVAFFSRG